LEEEAMGMDEACSERMCEKYEDVKWVEVSNLKVWRDSRLIQGPEARGDLIVNKILMYDISALLLMVILGLL
jgi:hypothetical protein